MNKGKRGAVSLDRKKWIILVSVVVAIGTFFVSKNFLDKRNTIHSYHRKLINNGVYHLKDAHQQLEYAVKLKQNDSRSGRIPLALKAAEKDLEMANEAIGGWSVYFTYKATGNNVYGGNSDFYSFYRAYERVLFQWQSKILEDHTSIDQNKLNLMKDDLEKVYNAFTPYKNNEEAMKDLTYEEVKEVLRKLAKQTKTKEVRERLEEDIFFQDI